METKTKQYLTVTVVGVTLFVALLLHSLSPSTYRWVVKMYADMRQS